MDVSRAANALVITNLKKNFSRVEALRGVSLAIPQGEFFGLLGPNGAGKSTLINCVVGLQMPTAGSVQVFDFNQQTHPIQARQRLGLSPQEVNLERFAPIEKMLALQGGYYGVPAGEARALTEQLLDRFHLAEKRNVPFYKLSGGMQKRVMIARALMGKPKLLILDEPTAGLDVELRHELWDFLRQLNREQGLTILLTTHYIDEAELLCGRVGIIYGGELIELGPPAALRKKYIAPSLTLKFSQAVNAGSVPAMEGLQSMTQIDAQTLRATGGRIGFILERLLAHFLSNGVSIEDVQIHQGSLEDVFIKVTGKRMDELEPAKNV